MAAQARCVLHRPTPRRSRPDPQPLSAGWRRIGRDVAAAGWTCADVRWCSLAASIPATRYCTHGCCRRSPARCHTAPAAARSCAAGRLRSGRSDDHARTMAVLAGHLRAAVFPRPTQHRPSRSNRSCGAAAGLRKQSAPSVAAVRDGPGPAAVTARRPLSCATRSHGSHLCPWTRCDPKSANGSPNLSLASLAADPARPAKRLRWSAGTSRVPLLSSKIFDVRNSCMLWVYPCDLENEHDRS